MEAAREGSVTLSISDPADLSGLADELIRFSGDSRVVAFFGPMGAGKTTFIRAICERLGVSENVSSPTFSIVNEYRTEGGESVFHFDFYRLDRPEEALALGVEEYFITGNWCFIEWPEKILNLLPDHRVDVRIEIASDPFARKFVFSHA
ncbi:MAG: hypothetical protein RL021_750 [Bacteroidota bacterium]|jgi:tRNA threonylcarbamoyladenosine biosynthesis protein TsaE